MSVDRLGWRLVEFDDVAVGIADKGGLGAAGEIHRASAMR